MTDELIVGIDLGTTNSAIAVWDPVEKRAVALLNQEHKPLTPSFVTFDVDTSKPIVGDQAVELLLDRPQDVIYSVKRFIGLSAEDERVKASKEQVTYRIESTPQHKVIIRAAEQILTPPQVSSYILAKLKQDAEAYLGKQIHKAVITVPAYFSEAQRHATMDAGRQAGFEVRRLVNEPTAAALAFELEKKNQTVAVYDLGGGTFDVSIVEINSAGMHRVVATKGDTHLGGDDFDAEIVKWIKQQFQAKFKIALSYTPHQEARLQEIAEQAKIDLSSNHQTLIDLKGLQTIDGQRIDFDIVLQRETFTTLVRHLIGRTLDICDSVLEMAKEKTGMLSSGVSQILLVGGQTLTPAVRNAIQSKYNWILNDTVDPGQVVSLGAAVLAGYLNGDLELKKRMRLWDVIAQPLGIEVKPGILPEGRTLLEVVKANQQIPYNTKDDDDPLEFTNYEDRQAQIKFNIYQGADPIAKNNTFLGTVSLDLINPKPKNEARVRCWFDIDWDGILEIHVKELDTDSEEIIQKIDYFYYLSQQEADQLV